MCDIVAELASAELSFPFDQPICSDDDEAKTSTKLFFRGVRAKRSVTAVVAETRIRLRRLKPAQIESYKSGAETLLDSGAISNLVSESLLQDLRFGD